MTIEFTMETSGLFFAVQFDNPKDFHDAICPLHGKNCPDKDDLHVVKDDEKEDKKDEKQG